MIPLFQHSSGGRVPNLIHFCHMRENNKIKVLGTTDTDIIPVPRVGERIALPNQEEGDSYVVDSVVYNMQSEDHPYIFVYIK